MQKEALGQVTTGIKAGGKIEGIVCYKENVTKFECNVVSSVVYEFSWAAEPAVPDNGGFTDDSGNEGDGDNEEDDSAMSIADFGESFLAVISAFTDSAMQTAAYGTSFIAAISALAF